MAEEVLVQMGFIGEEVKQAREKHANKEAKREIKKPKGELVSSKAKPKETKYAPISIMQSEGPSPPKKGVIKKKEKPKRTYVTVSLVASDTESEQKEEEVKAKSKGEFMSGQETIIQK